MTDASASSASDRRRSGGVSQPARVLEIEVWFDFVCPWCFIGKRNLDAALRLLAAKHPGVSIEIAWHPHPLLPETPAQGLPYAEFYRQRLGSADAVAMRQAQVREAARSAGIDDRLRSHRGASQHAGLRTGSPCQAQREDADGGAHAAEVIDALFREYFLLGQDIGRPDVLQAVAARCGIIGDPDASPLPKSPADRRRGVPFFRFGGRSRWSAHSRRRAAGRDGAGAGRRRLKGSHRRVSAVVRQLRCPPRRGSGAAARRRTAARRQGRSACVAHHDGQTDDPVVRATAAAASHPTSRGPSPEAVSPARAMPAGWRRCADARAAAMPRAASVPDSRTSMTRHASPFDETSWQPDDALTIGALAEQHGVQRTAMPDYENIALTPPPRMRARERTRPVLVEHPSGTSGLARWTSRSAVALDAASCRHAGGSVLAANARSSRT